MNSSCKAQVYFILVLKENCNIAWLLRGAGGTSSEDVVGILIQGHVSIWPSEIIT